MKKIIIHLTTLVLLAIFSASCEKEATPSTRSADKIEITLDANSSAILSYSANISATDYNLPATTGFGCLFRIDSEDGNGNVFNFNTSGLLSDPCPLVIATPSTRILTGNQIPNIQGIDIDYQNPGNSITADYRVFGSNVGDDIKIILYGTYYDSLGNSHTIYIDIDVSRT